MNITTSKQQEITIVHLEGDINGRTALHIQEAILPLTQPGGKLLLEMSRVSYLSGAGLRALLLLYRQIGDNAGRVALVGLPEIVHDTMSMTGFLDFFTTYNSLDEGITALRQI
jgi:anti-sigma B factor antagonist